MNEIELTEVWVSSVEHMENFNAITIKFKWWKRLLRLQNVDKTFPQVLTSGISSPLVFYSIGGIIINNEGLYYNAHPPTKRPNAEYLNLNKNLQLELK